MDNIPSIVLNIQGGQVTGKVGVAKDEPIHHLKVLIEVVLGVKADRQTLSFNDQVLDDAQTVEFYNLTGGATVTVAITPLPGDPKFRIKLKSDFKNDTVKVKESNLVEDLKDKIWRHWAVPATDITLTHLGKEMEDGFALSAYLICEDSDVEVKVNMEGR